MKRLMTPFLLLLISSQLPAAIIGVGTPIPASEVLSFGGLDWVYAGPVAPGEFGAGMIEAPSFRAGEGWRFATAAEWAARPAWTDFIKAPYTIADVPALGGWSDHTKYRFTSEYWSTFTWVDLNDAAAGNITNGLDQGCLTCVYETWYVRGAGQVPEPSTMGLLGLGLAGFSLRLLRRRG